MLDIERRPAVPVRPPGPVEFITIELSPLADGRLYISATGTSVADDLPELLAQELSRGHAATIDDALALIRETLRAALRTTHSPINMKEH